MSILTPPPPNLATALLRGFERTPDDWGEQDLHVSDLAVALPGEGCPRQLKLRLQGAERKPPTLGEQLMFDHGKGIHERVDAYIQRGLPRDWHIIHVEQSITGLLPHGIRGTIDNMIEHRPTKYRRVFDKKTVRGRAMSYVQQAAKPGNVIQVQGYEKALDLDGDLLYIDREGQNGVAYHPVERDDAKVDWAIQRLVQIRTQKELPPILDPVLERSENKGPDSLKLKQPWNCDYCKYQDVSCPGALKPEHRDLGIVAKVKKPEEELTFTTNDAEVQELVTTLFNTTTPTDQEEDHV